MQFKFVTQKQMSISFEFKFFAKATPSHDSQDAISLSPSVPTTMSLLFLACFSTEQKREKKKIFWSIIFVQCTLFFRIKVKSKLYISDKDLTSAETPLGSSRCLSFVSIPMFLSFMSLLMLQYDFKVTQLDLSKKLINEN